MLQSGIHSIHHIITGAICIIIFLHQVFTPELSIPWMGVGSLLLWGRRVQRCLGCLWIPRVLLAVNGIHSTLEPPGGKWRWGRGRCCTSPPSGTTTWDRHMEPLQVWSRSVLTVTLHTHAYVCMPHTHNTVHAYMYVHTLQFLKLCECACVCARPIGPCNVYIQYNHTYYIRMFCVSCLYRYVVYTYPTCIWVMLLCSQFLVWHGVWPKVLLLQAAGEPDPTWPEEAQQWPQLAMVQDGSISRPTGVEHVLHHVCVYSYVYCVLVLFCVLSCVHVLLLVYMYLAWWTCTFLAIYRVV